MSDSVSSHTSLYVAPANPAGRTLAKLLMQQGYTINGFVDNLKQGNDIYQSAAMLPAGSKVILHRGAYTDDVASGLLKRGFTKTALLVCQVNNESSGECVSFKAYQLPFSYQLKQAKIKLYALAFRLARKITSKRYVVYYAESFFDTNMLLAYREHHRQHPGSAYLLGRKLKQYIPELDTDKNKYEALSLRVLWRLCRTKRLVADHEFTGQTFSLIRQYIPVVQLWHGLPYKALSGNIHYPQVCDEVFVSSSPWFNKHIFPKIFRAKQYLALGYPRNDVFSQLPQERDWINAESLATLTRVQAETGDIIVYAPTYRDWGDNEYPLDLASVNAWCQQHQRSFVLKFHPFISRLFGEAMGLPEQNNLQQLPDYPHIYLYPSGKNVYPWLADAKALVTDYSSIAYDFLLADKPIIYFQYDKEEYLKLRGETLVSNEDFVAGLVVEDNHGVLQALSHTVYDSQRLTSKFGLHKQQASENIFRLVTGNEN